MCVHVMEIHSRGEEVKGDFGNSPQHGQEHKHSMCTSRQLAEAVADGEVDYQNRSVVEDTPWDQQLYQTNSS